LSPVKRGESSFLPDSAITLNEAFYADECNF
jgi:hypothetical protein